MALKEVISAYQFEDVVLIPLGALSEYIDIAIDSTPENKQAQGFIFNTSRTFYLDAEKSEVTIQGITNPYQADLVQVLPDDIYVEANLLSKWLNLQLSVNLFSSQLWIISEEPLPFQKKLEREKKIARSLARLRTNTAYYPRHYEPYQNTSIPFIDQSLRVSIENNENTGTDLRYDYTTHMTADLAKLESVWFLNGNDRNVV